MLAPLHGLLVNIFGDSFADSVVGILQWAAFVAIVYLALGAVGMFGIELPPELYNEGGFDVDWGAAILVLVPLVLVASQDVVEEDE